MSYPYPPRLGLLLEELADTSLYPSTVRTTILWP